MKVFLRFASRRDTFFCVCESHELYQSAFHVEKINNENSDIYEYEKGVVGGICSK